MSNTPDDPTGNGNLPPLSGLVSGETIDTSPQGITRLIAGLNPGRHLSLAVSNTAPQASAPATAGLKAALTPVTPAQPSIIAPPVNRSLPFAEQVSSLLGSPATPHELAEAMFRVNLTPGHEKVDLRPASALSDHEKLTLTSLGRKIATSTAEVSLLQPTQLAIWRGLAQPLRGPA